MDLEIIIKEHISGLYSLISQTSHKFSWTSVNKSLSKDLKKAKEKLYSEGTFQKDANLFSLIVEKIHGEGKGNSMLDFYNNVFLSLDQNLELKEKKLLSLTLNNILTNNDKNYVNFIGELATLNTVMRTNKYHLKSVEKQIVDNEKVSADFLLVQKADNFEIYLEVLNIHLHEKDFQDYSEIEYHLQSKFTKKKGEKILTKEKVILIQPVFWTKSEEQLRQLSKFYNETNFTVENIQTPLAYSSWSIDDNFEHRFESIKTILDN